MPLPSTNCTMHISSEVSAMSSKPPTVRLLLQMFFTVMPILMLSATPHV